MREVEGREPNGQSFEQAEQSFVEKLLQREVVFLNSFLIIP